MNYWIKQATDFKPMHLYKSVNKDWVVMFETLPDTVLNFFSELIPVNFNENNTLFSANKLKVISITHKFSKNNANFVDFYFHSALNKEYGVVRTGDVLIENVSEKHMKGIHVFKSYEAAYYSEIPSNFTGEMFVYRRFDGTLQAKYYLVNGKKNGSYIRYQNNEVDIDSETYYINDRENGIRNTYFGNSYFGNKIVLSEKIVNGIIVDKQSFKYESNKK